MAEPIKSCADCGHNWYQRPPRICPHCGHNMSSDPPPPVEAEPAPPDYDLVVRMGLTDGTQTNGAVAVEAVEC